jgi:phage gp29-like protein
VPSFEFDTREVADLAQFADALPKLVDVGMQIPEPWAREKLAIPDTQDGEQLLATAAPATQAALTGHAHSCSCCAGNKTVALSANPGTSQTPQQLLDGVVDEGLLVPDFNAQLNPVLKQATAAVMGCDSYEEASTALTALFPKMDNKELQGYMQKALYLADLLGQADAQA